MKRARDPKLIEAAMSARDLSYTEVAAVCGCSKGALINYVAGRRAVEPALAYRVARFLRQPVAELFVDVPASDEQSIGDQKAAS